MKYQNGLHMLANRPALEEAASTLVGEGWVIFRLSDRISNVEEFFDAIRAEIPLDPPVKTTGHWDALADSLWSGLFSLGEGRLVIVWPGAGIMERADGVGFQMAESVFREIANTLSSPRYTGNRPVQLVVLEALE